VTSLLELTAVLEQLPVPVAGWINNAIFINAAWRASLPFLSSQLEKIKSPDQLRILIERTDWGFEFKKIEPGPFWMATNTSEVQYIRLTAAKGEVTNKLIAGVAHEINNPLAIVLGISSMLSMHASQGTLKSEDVQKYSDKINVNIEKCSKLIKALRAFINWDDNPTFAKISLHDLVDEVSSYSTARFKNNKVKLEIIKPTENPMIQFNRNKAVFSIFGILSTRLDILKESADSQAKWITVEVDCASSPDSIIIQIRDNGFDEQRQAMGSLSIGSIAEMLKKGGGGFDWAINNDEWICKVQMPKAK
jgi:signal transduction histidine kinase